MSSEKKDTRFIGWPALIGAPILGAKENTMRKILPLFAILLLIVSCGGGDDVIESRLPVADCSLSSRDAYFEEEIVGVWRCVTPYLSGDFAFNSDGTVTAHVIGEGIVPGTWSLSGCVLELHYDNPDNTDEFIIEEHQILELTDTYGEFIDAQGDISRCRR